MLPFQHVFRTQFLGRLIRNILYDIVTQVTNTQQNPYNSEHNNLDQHLYKPAKEQCIHLIICLNSFPLVRFYEGVVELSLTAAEKKDPQGLGLHFYKHGEPEEDIVGLQAFQER